MLGAVSVLCGLAGIGDDNGDSLALCVAGAGCLLIAGLARPRVRRPQRPSPGWVYVGTIITWSALVAFGTVIYLVTGTLGRVDDAVVESAAGFTTTALTMIEASEVSRAMLLWRSATSWVGGLLAVHMAVVSLPGVLRSRALSGFTHGRRELELVPNHSAGTRNVLVLYMGFTVALAVAYLAVGLGSTEAAVVALGTASTGGFSGQVDSLASYGVGVQAVATSGMLLAGAGLFTLWWLVRGQVRPLWRSSELRTFLLLVVAAWLAVTWMSGASWHEALFMSASVFSTTGFALSDWTLWGDFVVVVLLVCAGIGSMTGSVGAGMRVWRARLLAQSAGAQLRLQLEPRAVVVVEQDGKLLSARSLDRLNGHQVAYVVLIGVGALALGAVGFSLQGSVWASLSALSTLGPAVGEVGAFGMLDGVSRPARLTLVVLMLGGRMSMPPLMAGLGFVLRWQRSLVLHLRLLMWRTGHRFGRR